MLLADRVLIRTYEPARSEKWRPALPIGALARFAAVALVFVGSVLWAYHAGKSSTTVASSPVASGPLVLSAATTRHTDFWQIVKLRDRCRMAR